MDYLQWRISTKSKPIKLLDHEIYCAYIHFQSEPIVEDAIEAAYRAAYRAGLKHGRKESQLSKN